MKALYGLILLVLLSVTVYPQARTASQLQTATVGTLDAGSPPLGSVRFVVDAKRQNGPCVVASVGETPIGADAVKTANGWLCLSRAAGAGTGTVTGFSAGGLTPLFTSSVGTPSSVPTLSFTPIAQTAKTFLAGPTTGGSAVPAFRAIVPSDFITGTVTVERCLRINISGQVVVAVADCGTGTGSGLADPGSNGIVKRTATNVTTVAVAGTDYLTPTGNGGALTGLAFTQLGGSATDAQVPNNITVDLATLATTATTATTANTGDSATAFFSTGTIEVARGGTGLGVPAEDQVLVGNATGYDLKTIPSCSNATNDKLLYNSTTNVFSCGSDQASGGGSGITSLNTLTGATQTFSDPDDTNVTLAVTSSGTNHAFTMGWTGTLAKARQHGTTVYTDQTNDFGAFLQRFQAGANFRFRDPADLTKTAGFDLSNITTATNRTVTIANADSTTVIADTGAANNFLTAVSTGGVISKAQPAFSNLSGSATDAQVADNITLTNLTQVTTRAISDTTGNLGADRLTGTTAQFNTALSDSDFATLTGAEALSNKTSLLIGHTTALGRLGQALEVTTSANYGGAALNTFSTTAAQAPILDFNRSKSATKGTQTVVASGDRLGALTFRGSDGTNFQDAAEIATEVDGTPGTGDMPGRLVFKTTADGAATAIERWRITNAGHLLTGTDDSWDIGASGATRPRTGYFGTSVVAPTFTGALSGNATTATTATTATLGDSATAFFSAGTIETARLGSGTANSTTYLRGDQTWATVASGGDMLLATEQTNTAKKTFNNQTLALVGAAGLPATCTLGDFAVNTTDNTLRRCTATNTWSEIFVAGVSLVNLGSNVTGTLDAEASGIGLTQPFKVWLAAAGCVNTTAGSMWDLPTATPAVAACVTGTNIQKGVLQFADTAGGFSAQNGFLLPADWAGAIDVKVIWRTSATSGNVKWSVSTISTATDATETDDPAFNTASTVTTAVPGTANRLQTSSIAGVTITGVAAGELLHLKVFRDGADAADTAAATVEMLGLEVTYRRSQ